MRPIRDILEAQSVVVIGASRDQEKPGAQLLKVLKDVGFAGRVAGVNPQGGNVFGVPLYPNVRDVPFEIDLAVLLIPPRFVPDALRDCAVKGVKGVVISAEGFAETGMEGATYQEDVRAILKSSGMRGFGPNTLGLVNNQTDHVLFRQSRDACARQHRFCRSVRYFCGRALTLPQFA